MNETPLSLEEREQGTRFAPVFDPVTGLLTAVVVDAASGAVLVVAHMNRDALVIRAVPAGPTCHTGATSCFYRRVEQGGEGQPVLVKVKT